MRRIDARLSERLRQAQQAQAGTSNTPVATRAKGKGHELTTEELEEQLNKLKEEELRCKAMRQAIRDRLVMMKPLRQDSRPVQQAPQPQRLRQQPIFIEEEWYSDEEEGEYRMPHQLRPQQDLATPLSIEFEELPWPPCFNPTILPQFDGDSDPKDFLLKYKAAIEAFGGGAACKVKAFVLSLKGLAQHWYSNLPGGHIHTWDQLRRELTAAFRAPKAEEVNACDFHNLKQEGSTLQEYLHRLVRLRARAPF